MAGNLRIDHLGAEHPEPAERPFFVTFDQARIASDIGREDRREPTFDASWPGGLHGASSVADYPILSGAQRALSMQACRSARHLRVKIDAHHVQQSGVSRPQGRCPFPVNSRLWQFFPVFGAGNSRLWCRRRVVSNVISI